MKPIYSTPSLPEAELLLDHLEENRMEGVLDIENAPVPAAAPLTISVKDSDEVFARQRLQEHAGKVH